MVRRRDPQLIDGPQYDPYSEATMISIKLHHGGILNTEPLRYYVGGQVDCFDYVDVEMFGLIEMKEFVEELGYDKQKEDDRLSEKWVDHDIEFDGEVGKGKSVDNQLFSHEMQNMIEGEHSEGGENSDEFQSVYGSDDEVTPKFPKFNPKTENKNPDLNIGLVFNSKKEVKFAIETHCLMRGMMYRFDRNDHRRLRARCKKEECEWYVYVSPIQGDKSWQVKGYNSVHNDWHFQIIGPFDQHNVDLLSRSCSCRRWDLTSIPCRHTISAIRCRNEVPEDYVHDVYKVSTYLRCYEHAIQEVNGAEVWPKCELPPPLPPKYENKPGRPKKMRRRQPDEPPAATNTTRLKKCLKSLKCGKCGVVGHNARTCNKRSGQAEEMPIGTS
ncbi:UNVERIFIED_CONTAM: hypothetical protein Sradi_5411600 [Sesamum radiatum]|uniref:SWIM-type domain-containing protein n=1 Tax=Sesamum radiatum TaxID=300843 RepID=A0AAW2L8E7_SESRA